MAKYKRKTLPKDFEKKIITEDFEKLKEIFNICDVNARAGYSKSSAFAFNDCPDDLALWLVQQGADISAPDMYGATPLHSRSRHWKGRIEILLELGADVNCVDNNRCTPLHYAAKSGNSRTTKILLEHGANPNATNSRGQTPLEGALEVCRGSQIVDIVNICDILIEHGRSENKRSIIEIIKNKKKTSHITELSKSYVQKIGEDFEFIRDRFNPDSLDESSIALQRLYQLFEVPPVPRRIMHDGQSPIIATAALWEDRHQELWKLLVPSSGHAATVQGEVIRISGRIHNEIYGNGGVNWNADYRKMAKAFLTHIASGEPLPESANTEARKIISGIKEDQGDTDRLCALAVEWVALNPTPVKLPTPDYKR